MKAQKTKEPKSKSRGARGDHRTPLVGIIMGSDSDLRVMDEAAKTLRDFDVPFEMRVVSAHRTPHEMLEYAESAEGRGLKVIIAGAGGAAHLPGMVAAATHLPVIGVPVNITCLQGLDALLSIVQMPKGVPVATVAIDNAANAAVLAVKILAIANSELLESLRHHRATQSQKVTAANARLKSAHTGRD